MTRRNQLSVVHQLLYIKGNLQRAIATGANTYHFPVGSNPYTPVVLEFTSGTAPGSLLSQLPQEIILL
ncbi:MAG: hypothetical protein ABIQ11_05720 [Saprospiraceae bacterium]